MTKEEYQKCEWLANLYRDKVRECKMLRRQLEHMKRENQLLKEHLGYKTARDVQYSKDDIELLRIFKSQKM